MGAEIAALMGLFGLGSAFALVGLVLGAWMAWRIVEKLGPRSNNVTGISYAVDLEWKYLELLRIASPEDEHRAPGDHVKQPLRENRQRKELPEASAEQQQKNSKSRLHGQSDRGRMEPRMNLS